MEPSDLTSSSPEDARIADLLRRHHPALPDDGFSRRVLAALPDERNPSSSRSRWIVCAIGAAVGLAVAAGAARSPEAWTAASGQLRIALSTTSGRLAETSPETPIGLALALVVTAASWLFAFRPRRSRILRF